MAAPIPVKGVATNDMGFFAVRQDEGVSFDVEVIIFINELFAVAEFVAVLVHAAVGEVDVSSGRCRVTATNTDVHASLSMYKNLLLILGIVETNLVVSLSTRRCI